MSHQHPLRIPKCFVCSGGRFAPTGECTNCGCYVCATCGKGHYGDGSQPCPGGGVTIPKQQEKKR